MPRRASGDDKAKDLVLACESGDLAAAAALLEAGADPDAGWLFSDPAAGRLAGFVRGESCLGFMAALGAAEGPEAGRTLDLPLCAAARREDPAMALLLLSAGASPAVRDNRGATALHHAAAAGPPATIEALIKAGADVHAREDNGWEALHFAAAAGSLRAISALAESGAALESRAGRDVPGHAPLHVAASFGRADACALLADLGADLRAQGPAGRTPYEIARAYGQRAAAAAIEGKMLWAAIAEDLAASAGQRRRRGV